MVLLKKKVSIFLVLLILVGCSSRIEEKFKIVTIVNPEGISIPILYYQDSEGDLYYRVLPDARVLNNEIDYLENYPVEWTLVEKPNFE